jgi:hypothetical protein
MSLIADIKQDAMNKYLLVVVLVLAANIGHSQGKQAGTQKPTAAKNVATVASEVSIDSVAFCSGLNQVLADGPKNFERIRGNVIDNNAGGTVYSATHGLPGAVTSSIANDKGWRYEAVMYQGKSKPEEQSYYVTYKRITDRCMAAGGYSSSIVKIDGKELENFPSVHYTRSNDASLDVVLSVDYSDIGMVYSLTVSIIKN